MHEMCGFEFLDLENKLMMMRRRKKYKKSKREKTHTNYKSIKYVYDDEALLVVATKM